MKNRRRIAISVAFASTVLVFFASRIAVAQLPAFPGAEGFGALATGGRGSSVYIVTNLNNSGPGSFRDAVSQPNRNIVFEVGGTINITSQLVFSNNVSVFGQTAPGGIAVYGHGVSMSNRNNIIVQHMTFRQGINSPSGTKAVNITGGNNIILDHVSMSWGRWDTGGITGDSRNITVQNSILSEAIDPQRLGMLVDASRDITLARNLWVNNQSRNPKGKGDLQFINNVVYNWGSNGYVGGHSSAPWKQDLINNYMLAGPNSSLNSAFTQFTSTDRVYHAGNLLDTNRDGVLNGRAVVNSDFRGNSTGDAPTFITSAQNNPMIPVTVWSAEEAYSWTLAHAGNSRYRDSADARIVSHVQSLGILGAIINSEAAVGGAPTIVGGSPPLDSSRDGIPDFFKLANGFGIYDPIHNMNSGDGYTWLEKYIHSLTDPDTPPPPPPPPPPPATTPWTISTVFGRGADAEVTENGGPNAVVGGNGTGAAMNARWTGSDGDRNEYILLRFDLAEIDFGTVYSAQLDLTAFRNMQNFTLRVYGLDADTEGQLWDESTVNFATAPGLIFDGNSGTRGLNSEQVTVLGDFVEGNALEGQKISFSSAALTAFLNQMAGSEEQVATLLIERVTENSGQSRFATKDATNLFSNASAAPAGSFAPRLELALLVPEVLPGDFNEDGIVDAADYVVWRAKGGTQAEYDAWVENFGARLAAGAGSAVQASVPELGTLHSVVVFVAALLVLRPRNLMNARPRAMVH